MGKMTTMSENEILGRIKMGVNVDIKRSDGRIHSAVVSGINIDTRSVTVEWFERGETKGKEVELETLLSLNQDLAPVNENGNKINKYVPRPTITPSNRSTTTTTTTTGAGGPRQPQKNKVRQTMNGVEIQQNNMRDEKQQQNGSENVPPAPTRGETKQSTLPPEKMETVSKGTGGTGTGANRRRSNVVKEIDRLKQNREARRAKQAEILEEKVTKQSIDPGNPNWEFLSMIRDYQEQLEYNPLQEGDDWIG